MKTEVQTEGGEGNEPEEVRQFFAIRSDSRGWRVIADQSELADGETFSETQPDFAPVVTGFAVRVDGKGYRAVDNPADILAGEIYADAAPAPADPFVELKASELAKFRSDREAMLNRITGISVAALIAGETAKTAPLQALRLGLLNLPSLPAVTAATTLPALKAAMQQAYYALVVPLPADLKADFGKVDA